MFQPTNGSIKGSSHSTGSYGNNILQQEKFHKGQNHSENLLSNEDSREENGETDGNLDWNFADLGFEQALFPPINICQSLKVSNKKSCKIFGESLDQFVNSLSTNKNSKKNSYERETADFNENA